MLSIFLLSSAVDGADSTRAARSFASLAILPARSSPHTGVRTAGETSKVKMRCQAAADRSRRALRTHRWHSMKDLLFWSLRWGSYPPSVDQATEGNTGIMRVSAARERGTQRADASCRGRDRSTREVSRGASP